MRPIDSSTNPKRIMPTDGNHVIDSLNERIEERREHGSNGQCPGSEGDSGAQRVHEPEAEPIKMKYNRDYDLRVDESQQDRAAEIKLCSFKRPHMRAFHYAWWCYHVAFLMWFSITPLLTEVQQTLNLTKEEIWSSSIAGVSGTIVMRFVLGPFCDKYGPRIPMALVLVAAAIPTGLIGLVNTSTGLTVIRLFIGVGGSTFVMCQYWTSRMFTKELVGTANATVAGWGNLGGGVTQILMGSILFPMFRAIYGGDSEKAWRTACVVPAVMGLITSVCTVKYTDDCPTGNYSKLKKQDQMKTVSITDSFIAGALNRNTWLLFVQYACCFGVEITMNNAAALYFKEEFDMTTESAAAVASIFGWMNLFARGVGGFVSDRANIKIVCLRPYVLRQPKGMKGRLLWQSFCLLLEGVLVVAFAYTTHLGSAIVVLILFSVFVQAAEGSTYGIVPYVNPPITGSVSGIIGAGGNVGAVAFGFCFRELDYRSAFVVMGTIIMFTSFLSVCVRIPAHSAHTTDTSKSEELPGNVTMEESFEKSPDSPERSTAQAIEEGNQESSPVT